MSNSCNVFIRLIALNPLVNLFSAGGGTGSARGSEGPVRELNATDVQTLCVRISDAVAFAQSAQQLRGVLRVLPCRKGTAREGSADGMSTAVRRMQVFPEGPQTSGGVFRAF